MTFCHISLIKYDKMKKIILILLLVTITFTGYTIDNKIGSILITNIFVDSAVVKSTCYLTSFGTFGKTADGTQIKKLKGAPAIEPTSGLPLIAMSHDLLKRFPLGTLVYIFIQDSCLLNGIYVVRDIMSITEKKHIDILIEHTFMKKNVKYKIANGICTKNNVHIYKL